MLLGYPRQFAFQPSDLGVPVITARWLRELLHPRVERMRAPPPQTLRNLRNRLAPFGNLRHRAPLEIDTEIGFAHRASLHQN